MNDDRQFKIEEGIPIPPGKLRCSKLLETIRQMKPGDSFVCPRTEQVQLGYLSRRENVKFASRKIDETHIRVWRVAGLLVAAFLACSWVCQVQAGDGCREEWRGYTIGGWNDVETARESVRFLMDTFGYQPISGPAIALNNDGGLTFVILQALGFHKCSSDPIKPEENLTADQLNAALVQAGLPPAFGRHIK
jgi:hypothetical protein